MQLFWRYWNNLPLLRLPNGSNVHFFKSGIRPAWDDIANAHGGKWVIFPREPERVFSDIALALIRSSIGCAHDICGVVYSVRPRGISINVWNRLAGDSEQVKRIGDDLRRLCALQEETPLQYVDHVGTINPKQKQKQEDKDSVPSSAALALKPVNPDSTIDCAPRAASMQRMPFKHVDAEECKSTPKLSIKKRNTGKEAAKSKTKNGKSKQNSRCVESCAILLLLSAVLVFTFFWGAVTPAFDLDDFDLEL